MIRAEIADPFFSGSDDIAIRLSSRDPDALTPRLFATVAARETGGAVFEYRALAEGDRFAAPAGPTLCLTDPEGRALLEALAAHYGGTGPAKAARDDLLHERSRVDKLTDALIGLAETLAGE